MATRQRRQASNAELFSYLGSSIEVIEALSPTDAYYGEFPRSFNPVWLALRGLTVDNPTEAEVELADALEPFLWSSAGYPNKTLIFTAYALAQTEALNRNGGAIGTGELGTIRQRWYFSKDSNAMGFKFAAQAFEAIIVRTADVVFVGGDEEARRAQDLGAKRVEYKTDKDEVLADLDERLGRTPRSHYWPKSGWGRAYADQQSKVLAELVRDGLTYDELWVRDASRDIARYSPLLPEFHAAILLEKQGLFEHFQQFSKHAGIPVLVAMSGVNAFSNIESILNDSFRTWEGDYKPSVDNPLHLLVISDHDYSGMVPIQGGAAAQFEHYLPGAVEVHRVGITPEQVEAEGRTIESAGYEFNYDRNRATREWADEFGLWVGDICYGLEVEALTPSAFVEALVDAIVEAVGGDEALRRRLLEAAEPDWDEVESRAQEEAHKRSRLLRTLAALGDWAQSQIYDHAPAIDDVINDAARDEGFRTNARVRSVVDEAVAGQENAVSRDAFIDYVEEGYGWGSWRPVSASQATTDVVKILLDEYDQPIHDTAQGLDRLNIRYALDEVADILGEFGLEVE